MAVRVDQLVPYGYTDTAISTFHAFGDGLIREYALELGLPTDLRVLTPAGGRHLPARAPLRVRARRVPAARRSDPLPGGAGDAVQPLQGRGHLAGRLPRPRRPGRGRGRGAGRGRGRGRRRTPIRRAARSREAAARGGAAAGRARPRLRRPTRRCWPPTAASTSATRSRSRSGSCGPRPRPASAIAGRFRYVLVDEFQDTNRAQAELVAALADRHRNVTVVGDDDQAIYAFRGAAVDNILGFRDRYRRGTDRRPAPQLPLARADPRRRLPADPVQRPGPARGADRDRQAPPRPAQRGRAGRRSGSRSSPRAPRRPTGSPRRSAGASRPAAAARDHAVLVRANGHADPILRALNMAAIPWRFSGTSGLYARPEVRLLLAFLRVAADLDSSVDLYALAASEVYGLGGEDLTAIVNMARRRNRSVWAVLEELDRQPGILRVVPETRATVTRLVADLRGYADAAHERPAGELLYRFLRGSGLLARLVGTDTPLAEEAAAEHRPFLRDRPLPVGAARRRSGHLRGAPPGDPHRGRRRSGHRGARPGRRRRRGPDRPQGEGPRVPGRLPARDGRRPVPVGRSRATPLALPAGLGRGVPPTAETVARPRSAGCATWR